MFVVKLTESKRTMKQIIIIPEFHSLIDVITNSSTELFICNTDKNEEAIKEFLSGLSAFIDGDETCGVGEIYSITEENIYDFISSSYWYLDELLIDVPDGEWEFSKKYFKSKGWDEGDWNSMNEEKRIEYTKRSKEAFDAHSVYFKKYINGHMEEYRKKLIGKTIIVGETDNSIPYEIWFILENKLNAFRIHCG